MSALCFRHLSASGPAGILESSVAMGAARSLEWSVEVEKASALHCRTGNSDGARLQPAREDGARDRQVAHEISEAEEQRERPQPAGPARRPQAERLEHAVEAVQQVKAQQTHGDNIED